MLGLGARALARSALFDETAAGARARRRPDVPYCAVERRAAARCRSVADAGVAHYYGVGALPAAARRRAPRRACASPPSASPSRTCPTTAATLSGARRSTSRAGRRACRATTAPAGTSTTSATTTSSGSSASIPTRCATTTRALPRARRASSTGEVMAARLRRVAARALDLRAAALVLWLRDLWPGAGWGVVDARGRPKAAYHHLRRALAPIAVWLTDEGLGGVAVHVANDGPEAAGGTAARRALPRRRAAGRRGGRAPSRWRRTASVERDVEGVLGRFVDVSWAYRFGPPAQDAHRGDARDDRRRCHPAAGPGVPLPGRAAVDGADRWRTGARCGDRRRRGDHGDARAQLGRLVHGLRIDVPGFTASDDAFDLEPSHARRIDLRSTARGIELRNGRLTAANLSGDVEVTVA